MRRVLLMVLFVVIAAAPCYGQYDERLNEILALPPYDVPALDQYLADAYRKEFQARNAELTGELTEILSEENIRSDPMDEEWARRNDEQRDLRLRNFASIATQAENLIDRAGLDEARTQALRTEVGQFVRTLGSQQARFHILLKVAPLAKLRDALANLRRRYLNRREELEEFLDETTRQLAEIHIDASVDRNALLEACRTQRSALNTSLKDMESYLDGASESESAGAAAADGIDNRVDRIINTTMRSFNNAILGRQNALVNGHAQQERIKINIYNQHHASTTAFLDEVDDSFADALFSDRITAANGMAGQAGPDGDQDDLAKFVAAAEQLLRNTHLQAFKDARTEFITDHTGTYLGAPDSDMLDALIQPRVWESWHRDAMSACGDMGRQLSEFLASMDTWEKRLEAIQNEEHRRDAQDAVESALGELRSNVNEGQQGIEQLQRLLDHRNELNALLPR